MIRRLGAVLVLCLLAGCAQHWTYTRPGLLPARLDQDLEACRREAHRPYWFAFTRAARVDQDALNKCMEKRGYTPHRED